MFRRYADDGATIADLARWLTSQGIPTRTGKHRWDRSVPPWGVPSPVGVNAPSSITPAFSQPAIMSLAGNDPSAASSRE